MKIRALSRLSCDPDKDRVKARNAGEPVNEDAVEWVVIKPGQLIDCYLSAEDRAWLIDSGHAEIDVPLAPPEPEPESAATVSRRPGRPKKTAPAPADVTLGEDATVSEDAADDD